MYVPKIDPENLIDLEDDGGENLCGDVQSNGSCIELEQLEDVQCEDAKQLWDPGRNVGQVCKPGVSQTCRTFSS